MGACGVGEYHKPLMLRLHIFQGAGHDHLALLDDADVIRDQLDLGQLVR
jgi:hypothetical protein